MEGLRLEDIIAGNQQGTLTEDEIVEFVRAGDPTNQASDDWPLRMIFRINSFLRANGPVPEADLADLAFLDDYFFCFQSRIASYVTIPSGSALYTGVSFTPVFPPSFDSPPLFKHSFAL